MKKEYWNNIFRDRLRDWGANPPPDGFDEIMEKFEALPSTGKPLSQSRKYLTLLLMIILVSVPIYYSINFYTSTAIDDKIIETNNSLNPTQPEAVIDQLAPKQNQTEIIAPKQSVTLEENSHANINVDNFENKSVLENNASDISFRNELAVSRLKNQTKEESGKMDQEALPFINEVRSADLTETEYIQNEGKLFEVIPNRRNGVIQESVYTNNTESSSSTSKELHVKKDEINQTTVISQQSNPSEPMKKNSVSTGNKVTSDDSGQNSIKDSTEGPKLKDKELKADKAVKNLKNEEETVLNEEFTSQWYEIYASPVYSFSNIIPNRNDNILILESENLNQFSFSNLGWSIGFNWIGVLSKNTVVKGGFKYTKLRKEFSFHYLNDIVDSTATTYTYNSAYFEPVHTIREQSDINYFSNFGLEIGIQHYFPGMKIRHFVRGNIGFEIIQQKNQVVGRIDPVTGVSFSVGYQVEMPVSKSIKFFISPGLLYYLRTIDHPDLAYTLRPYAFELKTGIAFHLFQAP